MSNTYLLSETVIDYEPEDFKRWKTGEKTFLVPRGDEFPSMVVNQPNYHFGEYYVYRHFLLAQWKGCVWYAIGTWQPTSKLYLDGRQLIEKLFPDDRLSRIRKEIRADGKGEPDLFFYRDSGDSDFVEVKKQSDRTSLEQLRCLALIKGILGADIAIVYLKERGRYYTPKRYELNIESFSGCRID